MRALLIEFILYAIFCTKVLHIVNFIYSSIYACRECYQLHFTNEEIEVQKH